MLTFLDCKQDDGIRNVAKACPDSPEFAQLVNKAVRKLMRRGDWQSTLTPAYFCVRNGCVVFDRYVGNVRRLNICNRTIPVHNMWGTYLEGKGGCHYGWHNWRGGDCSLTNEGKTSVFQDIQGEGRTVRVYTRCNVDYGKKTWIFGVDNNGQPLQTDNGDGTFSMGVVITAAAPFGSSNTFIRHIDYTLREATQCPTDMYAYNATTNLLEDVAHYEPSETRPSYEKARLGGNWPNNFTTSCAPGCCSTVKGVLAMVKLKFIPAIADTDLILIDNLDALALEIQSIKFAESGDLANSVAYEASSIRELNRQLEDDSPDDQFSVSNNVFGGASFTNSCF